MLPDGLEGMLTKYSPEQITIAIRIFDKAIEQVAQFWPNARKGFVYIPAPVTIYDVANDEARKARIRSEQLEQRLNDTTIRHGFEPIPFSQGIRDLARTTFVHGPTDWNHFNKAGYTFLGKSIAKFIKKTKH